MSRSRNNPRKHRKIVKNKYLQIILMRYGDDFGGTRGKDKTLSRVIRAREKQRLRKEVKDMWDGDTIEAGGGSYPEPPATGVKEYTLTLEVTCFAKVIVQAKSQEEAEELIDTADLDIIQVEDYDIYNVEVEELD